MCHFLTFTPHPHVGNSLLLLERWNGRTTGDWSSCELEYRLQSCTRSIASANVPACNDIKLFQKVQS